MNNAGIFYFMSNKAQENNDKRREIELNDLAFALKSNEVRRVLWRILERAGAFKNPFALSGGKREWTDFFCGQQDLGLWLYSEILTVSPQALELMKRANDSREKMDVLDTKKEIKEKSVLERP